MSAPTDEGAAQGQDVRSTAPAERPPWTRRAAPVILIAGAVLTASVFFGRIPREREVELKLDDAEAVRGVEVTWTDAHSVREGTEGTPLQGSSWHFAEGTAPRSLRTTVRLPDGAYALEIAVDRSIGHDTTRRMVTLGNADRIAVSVR
jgi:hypothetical protein